MLNGYLCNHPLSRDGEGLGARSSRRSFSAGNTIPFVTHPENFLDPFQGELLFTRHPPQVLGELANPSDCPCAKDEETARLMKYSGKDGEQVERKVNRSPGTAASSEMGHVRLRRGVSHCALSCSK